MPVSTGSTVLSTPAEPWGVTADGAAALLGISRAHFWNLHRACRTPEPIRLGKRTLWDRAALLRWWLAGAPPRDQGHPDQVHHRQGAPQPAIQATTTTPIEASDNIVQIASGSADQATGGQAQDPRMAPADNQIISATDQAGLCTTPNEDNAPPYKEVILHDGEAKRTRTSGSSETLSAFKSSATPSTT